MYRFLSALLAVVAVAGVARAGDTAKQSTDKPQVEVVFCLDTTGSMGGLIDAAKQKIWAISNQIAGGKPTPNLKVGLVAYRDRGDAYVTKVFDLTDDLDAIHGELMKFKAEGGNDFPESVNEALHVAVTKIKWSSDKKTLRMIFLVGDAPPHMDYKDDVKYPVTCKLACEKEIIINSVQCGDNAECKKYWLDICRLAEGSYVQIDARGGPVVTIATPFDKDLVKINDELCRTTLCYGDKDAKGAGEAKKGDASKFAAAAAERAAFAGKNKMAASYDLLDSIKSGKVKLEELKKDELPEELQKLTPAEQKDYLGKLEKRRVELNTQAVELDKKRTEFIQAKLKEDTKNQARDSFDNQVLTILQRQAARNGINYGVVEEKKK